MTLETVKREIDSFLSSETPEVLCIKGKWGVGKTYAWNHYLKQANNSQKCLGLRRYSYVSLFGINTLDAVKYTIFENTTTHAQSSTGPSIETIKSNVESVARKSSFLSNILPKVSTAITLPMFFMTVRNQIVCFDDLERRGKGLDIGDVLGLASFLKEQRACKVVILLNDLALESDDKGKLASYLEKVIDKSLVFSPTPQESVSIAVSTETEWNVQFSELCISIGISNIRIIKRIETFIARAMEIIKEYHDGVKRQAIRSLSIFGWSVFESTEAPTLDFLLKRHSLAWMSDKKDATPSPKEAAWETILSTIGFSEVDEFDRTLLDGLKNGFFDKEKLNSCALDLDKNLNKSTVLGDITEAWNLFYSSFDDDEEKIVNSFCNAIMNGSEYININTLNDIIFFLNKLGHSEKTKELIKNYAKVNLKSETILDVLDGLFAKNISDKEIITTLFNNKVQCVDNPTPLETMIGIAKNRGYNDKDITLLSKISVDQYYEIFKSVSGSDLDFMIKICQQFDSGSNPSEEKRLISKRVKEALEMLAKSSRLNALRAKNYGVYLDNEGTKEGEDADTPA